MKKAIIILVILVLTITLGIVEIHSVRKTLTSLEDMVYDINQQFESSQDDISIYYDDIGDLREYWEKNENWLCFIFNHRDLSIVTDSINKLIAYTKNNDYDNAICEISLLKEYSTKSYHIMGFNIHNIL